jgi:hypothetical protein
VKKEKVEEARAVLARMRGDVESVFAQAKRTHFITASVLPAQMRGKRELPPTLLFLTSYWGPVGKHLDELIDVAGDDLRELFSHCQDAPEPRCSRAELAAYMKVHRKPDTFYSGMHNVTHEQVLGDARLRRAIEDHIDADPAAFAGLTSLEAREKIQAFVRSDQELVKLAESPPVTRTDALKMYRHVILVVLVLVVLTLLSVAAAVTDVRALDLAVRVGWISLGAIVAVLLGLFLLMRLYEVRHDGETAKRQPDDHVKELENCQLNPVINEFTVAGPVKGGVFRPIFLRILLWIVARYVVVARISIKTVAAARWLAIDGGRRLVFVSNYTNMAEGYVRDFIDTVAGAGNINLVFCWGMGYPRTRFLYLGGARDDSNGFINVVHAQTRVTGLWYCPYKDLSIDNIKRNRALREGLFDDRNELQARDWLRKL